KDARPEDVVQPGHIFPLMARPGGVLTRAGHTEAGCDLARLAGAEPAAVIVEILNEDGSMARRPDLEKFAAEHGLKIGTIEDLIRYRLKHEHSVERVAESVFPTRFGEFRLHAYQDSVDGLVHLALVKGVPKADAPTVVRVQVQNTLCDVLYGETGCGWPIDDALQRIAQAECGVLVLLRPNEEPRDLVRRIQMLAMSQRVDDKLGEGAAQDQRTYGIGAQILLDLGVRKMHVMSAPKRFHALAGFGLEAVDYISD
ncbi:MAG: 3,4-dihydroxy-2-butanone-4-phosphate synthase, partial [Halothiobacillaceae bacterium]|nr:3,4-dihydroxy-2-butanone-4-phosphate synthase [Halothiobacillaceae bacterium]